MEYGDEEEQALQPKSPRRKSRNKGKCSSLVVACVGVLVLSAGIIVLGMGELTYVCHYRGVFLAEIEARPVDCNSSDVLDEFAFLSCPLDFDSFTIFTPATFNVQMNPSSPFAAGIRFGSAAGQQVAEMYQCIETRHDAETYNYSLAWVGHPVDTFENANWLDESSTSCPGLASGGNPRWPTNLAIGTETERANVIRAGAFNLTGSLIEAFELDGDVSLSSFASNFASWSDPNIDPTDGLGEVNTSNLRVSAGGLALESCAVVRAGCVNVKYRMSTANWASAFTHIGAGHVSSPQETPQSWICGESHYEHMLASTSQQLTKAELIDSEVGRFDGLASGGNTLRRVVCCVLIWLGVFLLLQPLFEASEAWGECLACIPICGRALMNVAEGAVSAVICVFSMLCGVSLALITVALAWVHVRPWMSVWMSSLVLLLCLCSCICLQLSPQKKRAPDSARSMNSNDEYSDEEEGEELD